VPITVGAQIPPGVIPDSEVLFIKRVLVIIGPDGNEVLIRTREEFDRILDSMTPEQLEEWKKNYRFTPVRNYTGNPNYTGTVVDTL
jgi:hypothetical protein